MLVRLRALPQKVEEGIRSFRAGVRGICQLPDLDAMNSGPHDRKSGALKHQAISPALHFLFTPSASQNKPVEKLC